MRKTTFTVFLSLTIFCATAARAQPAALVAEAAPSAHKLEMAKRIIAATGINDSMTGMMRRMVYQVTAKRIASLPADQQAKAKVFEDAQADAVEKMVPKLIAGMTEEYARVYSESEMAEILVFYESPAGHAVVAKTPLVMKGVSNLMVTDLVPKMMRDIGEEVCAKTVCTDEEKATFFGTAAPKS